jgi:subtilisin family serine protease
MQQRRTLVHRVRNLLPVLAGLLVLLLLADPLGFAAAAPASPDAIPDQYIVVLHDTVARPRDAARDLSRRHGLGLLYVYEHAIKGFAATIPPAALSAVARDPRVQFISEDRVVVAFQQTLPTGVNRINAENKTNAGAGVHVAVLDTGIDLTHPDLQANIAGGKNCSTGKSYNDGNGHGTHVAGIVAALNNDVGVVGVAPGAFLWAVRVLNNAGSGSWSSVICGVDFVDSRSPAKGGPISVANMSLGGSGADDGNCGLTNNDALHKAICRAVADGVTIVAAAGNSAADLKSSVPAAYDEVIAVTALADSDGRPCGSGVATGYGPDDTFASFSNYATVDLNHTIAAPGVSILSTYKGGGYATLSGTSMASPHVAGAAALYLAAHPGASPATVFAALVNAGEPLNVNFVSECPAGGASHTDPSSRHLEPVVRADGL